MDVAEGKAARVRRTMFVVGLPGVLADLDDDGKLRRVGGAGQ